MSEITLCDVNNINIEKSCSLNNQPCYMEEPISLNKNYMYKNISKSDFSSLTSKEKALAFYYTQNNTNSIHSSVNNKTENYSSIPFDKQKNIFEDLVQSVKHYSEDVNIMLKDLFNTSSNSNDVDLASYDIEDFFKYSLIIGQKECSVSEILLNNLYQLSENLVHQAQEIQRLQSQKEDKIINHFITGLKQASTYHQQDLETYLQKDTFSRECLASLEDLVEQMDTNKLYYHNQIHTLLNEIRQRDELLDCYQKRENYLFNIYYPNLIEKFKSNYLTSNQNKEAIVSQITQEVSKVERAFQEKLVMKNNLIEEIKRQNLDKEATYIEKLKSKDEIISNLNAANVQMKEKEKNYQNEIAHYKKRFKAQTELAEQIRNQIQSQQIEYCNKIEEMQQSLDSRGKIIAYVQNKLNIRENELKIANIKYTTAERQMNIEKDQYKREIANLKEEIEKSNEDIDDLENELDTQEEEHKEEIARLEKEHDFQINKLWNIIDQRETTISEMEFELDDLKEKTTSLEQSLSKYESVQEDKEENTEEEAVETSDAVEIMIHPVEGETEGEGFHDNDTDDINEKSSITVTGDASEEIIILDDHSKRFENDSGERYLGTNILTPDLTAEACEDDITEDEKTGLTTNTTTTSTEEKYDDGDGDDEETNSLTLTEDLSDESRKEIGRRNESVGEENGEEGGENEEPSDHINIGLDLEMNLDKEIEMRKINEENENLKRQIDIIQQDNSDLRRELLIEKENLKQENEKWIVQQRELDALSLQYTQVCNEKKALDDKYRTLETEAEKRKAEDRKYAEELKAEYEQQIQRFQKEREVIENRLKEMEEQAVQSVPKEDYQTLEKELKVALEDVSEQRRKKNYLKQKLASSHEKNKSLVELIKRERIQNKEEIRQLKQSCIKQNGKVKAILKQVKDGLVTTEHIDLDRIVKRMKSERILMNNEYERLKRVASSLSIKSNASSKKPPCLECFTDLHGGKELDTEGNVEITIKQQSPNKSMSTVNSESKILIKVSPTPFEPLPDESVMSRQANDSLNSFESLEEHQELEEFNLKKALNQHGITNFSEDEEDNEDDIEDQNSFIDFTSPSSYEYEDHRRESDQDRQNISPKDNVSFIFGDEGNKMTTQQVKLYNRILQIPGVIPFNINSIKMYDYDDPNFSITSDSSILKDGESFIGKNVFDKESISPNRIRYNSHPNKDFEDHQHHCSLRRMPNFDQIAKLTQIKIKHSNDELII